MKLAQTTLRHIIIIKKLNNIIINCFQNPRTSVVPHKWRFDSNQDWKTLALDFGGFSTDDMADETLRALGIRISATGYLEEESPRFTDITELELTAKPAVMDNPGQIVMDSEEEMVKKKNKCVAKRKERLVKLCAFVRSLLFPYPKSSLFSSLCSMPAPMPAIISAPMPAVVPAPVFASVLASFSRLGSPVLLLSGHLSALVAVSCCKIPALMSPLFVLGPTLSLGPSSLKRFK